MTAGFLATRRAAESPRGLYPQRSMTDGSSPHTFLSNIFAYAGSMGKKSGVWNDNRKACTLHYFPSFCLQFSEKESNIPRIRNKIPSFRTNIQKHLGAYKHYFSQDAQYRNYIFYQVFQILCQNVFNTSLSCLTRRVWN
jgi:hypothetical protein